MLVAILCTPNRGESEVLSGALYNTRELARPNVTRQLSGGCLHVIKFDWLHPLRLWASATWCHEDVIWIFMYSIWRSAFGMTDTASKDMRWLLQSPKWCIDTWMHMPTLSPSSRHHLSYDDCLKDRMENYQDCSVLCCVWQLCTLHNDTRTHEQFLKMSVGFRFRFRFGLCVFVYV